ncbi:class I SAM-dependent methyltransferase [Streptomyces zhihengii]|uniref:class I SAM-dependent methyltransferase n=1 Tax=Streptomyces zhihengii TaxID=1818004 RepID=UPI0036D1D8B8
MSHAPDTPAEYWDTYMPHRGDGEQPAPAVERFEWTQYPGHGPDAELLGQPHRALELGPAEGKEAVFLARQGADVVGVDLSAVQVERASRWWRHEAGVAFVHADACDYLASAGEPFDAVYSVWGAVWFTDPEVLLPLVAARLTPGGVLAFSQAEPVPEAWGPQPMRGKWLEERGRELTVLRWQYPPAVWGDLLKRHGFTDVDAHVLAAPEAGRLGTLMVRATRAEGRPRHRRGEVEAGRKDEGMRPGGLRTD